MKLKLLSSFVLLASPALSFLAPRVTAPTRIAAKSAAVIRSSLAAVSMPPNNVDSNTPTSKPANKSYLDDGFVFGLEGSGLERPKGKVAQIVVEGDSLETTWWQVAAVAVTMSAHACFAGNALHDMILTSGGIVAMAQGILLFLVSFVLADFGSGVLHWSVDNYGNGRTPIMGNIIAAFQGHHSAPWTITERGFCNNVYKLCIPFGIVPMTLINYIAGPKVTLFMTFFCVFEILSQEFHKWSHMTKGQCPKWVNWLQDSGMTIGRRPHALHHLAPYEGNYCIISGFCNNFLDKSGLWRRMEHFIYNWNGIESNAWKLDPDLRERTLNGDYRLLTQ